MARLTLDEVLASVLVRDDDSDDFSHLDSESQEEEDEGMSAYTCQQQYSLEKLAILSQVVSTEPFASSSSNSSRLYIVLFLDSAGGLEKRDNFTGKLIAMNNA